jgi:hypothetical protein
MKIPNPKILMDKKIPSEIAIGLLVLLAVVIAAFLWMQNNKSDKYDFLPPTGNGGTSQPGQVCPQMAKQCDDGSYVNMTGPNCEFAPCPEKGRIANPPEKKEGGACAYDTYPGRCVITALTKESVRFTFKPHNPIENRLWSAVSADREWEEELNIIGSEIGSHKKGDAVECEVRLENKGTCTPIIFKLIFAY